MYPASGTPKLERRARPSERSTPMTATTTVTYPKITTTTTSPAVDVAFSRTDLEPATPVRNQRRAEVIGWLTRQLDWEHHLDHLRDDHAQRTAE
jgi:hypothetical protein